MRPPVDVGVHRAPRCEPVVSLVRSRRAPPVPLIVLPKSCSCRWGPCPRPIPRLACLFSFFLSFCMDFGGGCPKPQAPQALSPTPLPTAQARSHSRERYKERHTGTEGEEKELTRRDSLETLCLAEEREGQRKPLNQSQATATALHYNCIATFDAFCA